MSALVACSGAGGAPEEENAGPSTSPSSEGGSSSSSSDGGTSGPKTATVRVHYPAGARAIGLTGAQAPFSWDKPTEMKSVGSDTWELALGVIAAAIEVKPMLDQKASRGPSYVVHPGESLEIYPHFVNEHGKVAVKWPSFESKALPSTRAIRVYVPPSYEENTTAHFPVIYMHDGQTLFGDTAGTGEELQVDEAFDTAAESGAFPEAIVVGIDARVASVIDLFNKINPRTEELTPTRDDSYADAKNTGKGPQYLSMIIDELKPKVDAEYRTRPDRESTFTIGYSLGGLISVFAGIEHGDVFGGIGGMSSSAWWDKKMIVAAARAAKVGPTHAIKVYDDVGDAEEAGDIPHIEANKELFQAYAEAGYVDGTTLKTYIDPGAKHEPLTWRRRLPSVLAFLLGPGR